MNHRKTLGLLLLGALSAGGCTPGNFPPAPIDLPARSRDVDLLLVIASSTIAPQQRAFVGAVPGFLQRLDDAGVSYHIGVTTTDVGSWKAPSTPWATAFGSCNSYEGDDGRLQREACNVRSGLTNDAITSCQTLCPDPRFVPAAGQGFIRKSQGSTNVPLHLENGRDIGTTRALQCLALVGDAGCGLEAALEGARRALDGHRPDNAGFLRAGSLLAVIFLTDEDDCSVALSRRAENDPITRDCTTADKDAPFECFNPDYRCLARSTECNEPLNTPGQKTGCRERATSYLEPVASYASFFQRLRTADRLLLSGLWTLPALGDPGATFHVDYQQMGTRSADLNRASGARAGCVNRADARLYAYPQHRLSRFIRGFPGSVESSICDTQDYPATLDKIADAILAKL